MTYGEAVESALRILTLGTTSYSHEQYDDILLQYANAAVLELSKDSRPVAVDEVVSVVGGQFLFSSLAHAVYSLIRVVDTNDQPREFCTRADGNQVYLCNDSLTGNVKVTYSYFPEAVTTADMDNTDIPLPEQYHRLVPFYIAGQYQLSSADRYTLASGQSQMQIFNSLRRGLHKPENGTTRSHKIRNRGW